jgi:hypothetical protein
VDGVETETGVAMKMISVVVVVEHMHTHTITISRIRVAVMIHFRATLHLDVRELGACFRHPQFHQTIPSPGPQLRRFNFG